MSHVREAPELYREFENQYLSLVDVPDWINDHFAIGEPIIKQVDYL